MRVLETENQIFTLVWFTTAVEHRIPFSFTLPCLHISFFLFTLNFNLSLWTICVIIILFYTYFVILLWKGRLSVSWIPECFIILSYILTIFSSYLSMCSFYENCCKHKHTWTHTQFPLLYLTFISSFFQFCLLDLWLQVLL